MGDNVLFTWTIDPPEPVDGQVVKSGDIRQYDRTRAERWATQGYGRVENSTPDRKPEKSVDFMWGVTPGYTNGQYVKVGDIQRLPLSQAEQYEVAAYGSIGTALKDGWRHPNPNSEMARRVRRRAFAARPKESMPRKVLVNVRKDGTPVYAEDGWVH